MDDETRVRLAQEHYDQFEELSQNLGIDSLTKLVPYSKEKLQKAYEKDTSFNSTRLADWDARDPLVRILARKAGYRYWSLSDTVCVLKHVARYHLLGIEQG